MHYWLNVVGVPKCLGICHSISKLFICTVVCMRKCTEVVFSNFVKVKTSSFFSLYLLKNWKSFKFWKQPKYLLVNLKNVSRVRIKKVQANSISFYQEDIWPSNDYTAIKENWICVRSVRCSPKMWYLLRVQYYNWETNLWVCVNDFEGFKLKRL